MEAHSLKETLKKIRSFCTFYVAEQTPDFVKAIRLYELDVVSSMLPPEGRLLEIGAGTGWQAEALEKRGYNVSAIDLPSSDYRENRIWPVVDYDGQKIPFDDNTFDIVFSSNALEHIPHIYEFQNEIHRVLKLDGCVLHVIPSSSWRFWSSITHLLKFWTVPTVHGEHAGNFLTEIYYFSCRWWAQLFRETGWIVVAQKSNKLFYTGSLITESRLSISMRNKLSRNLGGSCNIFVLTKKSPK
ncbi:class I SAM-dependent methyltransferase [Nitrospinae bacterium]|nr:class I SAM-dependent methyltransferase [Nitrospinota bacterium]